MDACLAELEEVTAKPMALTGSDRVSTRDFLDLELNHFRKLILKNCTKRLSRIDDWDFE